MVTLTKMFSFIVYKVDILINYLTLDQMDINQLLSTRLAYMLVIWMTSCLQQVNDGKLNPPSLQK